MRGSFWSMPAPWPAIWMISRPLRMNSRTCNGCACPQARDYDLPFITEVVLAEVEARAHDPAPPASVPFFRNDDEASLFIRLRGISPRSDE